MSRRVLTIAAMVMYLIPVGLLTIKPIAPVLMASLILLGIYLSANEKIWPHQVRELKLFSILTVGYFFVMAMSVALSVESTNSWIHLSRIAYFLFAPFAALAIYKSDISINIFLASIKMETILVGLIVVASALVYESGGRHSGMYNANTFSDITVTLVLFSSISVKTESIRQFIFSLVAVSFGMVALVLSGSRAGLITIAFMMLVYLFVQKIMPNGKYMRAVILVLVATSSLSISLYVFQDTTSRMGLIETEISSWEFGKKNTGSVGIRLEMYRAGLMAFADAPLIGYGYHNSNTVASRYATTEAASIQMARYWHLHNEYITTMVNAGILGLIVLILLYVLPMRIFLRNLKHEGVSKYAAMGIFLIISYALLNMTHGEFGYEYETLWFIIILAYALMKVHKKIL